MSDFVRRSAVETAFKEWLALPDQNRLVDQAEVDGFMTKHAGGVYFKLVLREDLEKLVQQHNLRLAAQAAVRSAISV